ncbi:hypothetical protein JCGZ_02462 [Jatropha curcas]|uniref:Prephenate/arogenate dehydrogenase domain-containing protein n=1 Tax=Jatropha curcas TaxID=180498 RepID=A0A067JG07_JATCU|nr:hypothetical protein JCGZ_02462 [Jatropha curcas]
MLEMSCQDQDKYAAGSQFITHTVGRVLKMLKLESTPINTKGYESLLDLVENTVGDSFDLYYGLFMHNKNALELLERLDLAFESLRKQLFGRLHEAVRKQLSGNGERGHVVQLNYVNGRGNGTVLTSAAKYERSEGAAQPYMYMGQLTKCIDDNSKLQIGIVGFGNFGQFLTKTFVRQGHTVLAYSHSDYSDVAQKLGVSYFSDADDLCEEHPKIILLCTSILSTENVLKSLPVQRLKRSTLFVDVISVKEFPRNLFLQHLPSDFDILCTHSMFGLESELKIATDKSVANFRALHVRRPPSSFFFFLSSPPPLLSSVRSAAPAPPDAAPALLMPLQPLRSLHPASWTQVELD